MTAADRQDLRGGACQDLPPAVVDKYFMADGHRQRFEFLTAKAMCGHCAVRSACLEEAIVQPPGHGVRGGESNNSLWDLHGRWMKEHIEADVLAAAAITRQHARQTLGRTYRVRRNLPDVPLAYPESGGAA